MSKVTRLPPELSSFMELPGNQTLLIRGPPGSGKTTLSLALLEAFRGDKVLVTSRVGENELVRGFPWLGNNGARSIQVIDTSASTDTVADSSHLISRARQTLSGADAKGAEDLSSFLWLPPPIQDAWSRLDAERRALVVIDSWEALVEQYLAGRPADGKTPNRADIERLLLRRMGQLPAHVVFVLEREEQTSLDYLVNGVVTAEREARDERLQRWLTILKLRGVRIDNPVYPYTLEGAKFESILPAQPYSQLKTGRPDPEPDAIPGYMWPGSKDFAAAFGRLPFGRLTLLELDDATPIPVGDMLTTPAAAHAISKGGRVLIIPHSSETAESVAGQIAESLPRGQVSHHLRLIVPRSWAAKESETLPNIVIPLKRLEFSSASGDPSQSEPIKFVREGAGPSNPSLMVISIQGLEAVALSLNTQIGPDSASRLPDALLEAVRGAPIHVITVCPKTSVFLNPLRAVASVRVEVNIRQGRIFLHGVSPWTPNHVLTGGSEESVYSLLRVV